MKIKFKNFLIEEDTRSFILTELWIRKTWDNVWEEYNVSTIYPSTFENCLLRILHSIKKNKQDVIELNNYIEALKIINEEFLNDLRLVINK
jgi:hypothetical protein